MLYALLTQLSDTWFGFNVFRYITFRAGLGISTAFFIRFEKTTPRTSRTAKMEKRTQQAGDQQHQGQQGATQEEPKALERVFGTGEQGQRTCKL